MAGPTKINAHHQRHRPGCGSCTTASSRTSRNCAGSIEGRGAKFATETDTEVIAHLVTDEMSRGADPVAAVTPRLPRLRGAFAAVLFLFAGEDDL